MTTGPSATRVSAIVPTVGASPWLLECLEALRQDGGASLEIVLVDQGARPLHLPEGLGVRTLRLERNVGFAAGVNRGLDAARGELLATINDDLKIERGWIEATVAALGAEPRAAAVQGWVLQWRDPQRFDGCGLAFNRRWQAVQLGHGQPVADAPAVSAPMPSPREVFGVSATAALYRRAALDAVRLADGSVFDPRLGSYYEDVDLAVRLRAAGWSTWSTGAARALHAGSATAGIERLRWVYGNRYPVLARLLGRRMAARLPRIVAGDLLDLARAGIHGRHAEAGAILLGLARGARLLPRALHGGAPRINPDELERLAAESFSPALTAKEGTS
ncbi:MAG: glycosyltransferase [Acidobacteria bacterium]|nr:glycosyltransferase [Acidobacteriota bacterium]